MGYRHTCNATSLTKDGALLDYGHQKRTTYRGSLESNKNGIGVKEGDPVENVSMPDQNDYIKCAHAATDDPPTWPGESLDQTWTQNVAISPEDISVDAAGDNLVFTSTPLPPGIVLSSAGILTGTPTDTGVTQVTYTATNSGGSADSIQVSMTVNA